MNNATDKMDTPCRGLECLSTQVKRQLLDPTESEDIYIRVSVKLVMMVSLHVKRFWLTCS